MQVNDELVDQLAHLSRLNYSGEEKAAIKGDLQKMIAFIEKLSELDTEGLAPLLFMTSEVNVLRSDEVKGSITRQDGLKNAPLSDEVYFKVPKVIKK